ncbi:leucine-rich repeat domain-containing protein [Planctomycetota bacterium]|nr:leucine-rich repeat domain-containing protein [Planctomycetota bacterium]
MLSIASVNKVEDLSFIGNLSSLTSLTIYHAPEVADLSSIGNLSSLTSLTITSAPKVADLSSIGNLSSLTSFHLGWGIEVDDLSFIGNLSSLTSLTITSAPKVTDLSFIGNLSDLTALTIAKLGMKDLSVVNNLKSLTSLRAWNPTVSFSGELDLSLLKDLETLSLSNHSSLSKIISCPTPSLRYLELDGCSELTGFEGLSQSVELIEVDLSDTKFLSSSATFQNMASLKKLMLQNCSLTEIEAFPQLTSLRFLSLDFCSEIKDFSPLKNLNLQVLSCDGILKQIDLDEDGCIQSLKDLRYLSLADCKEIVHIDGMKNLANLEGMALMGCESLIDINGLSELPYLVHSILPYEVFDGEPCADPETRDHDGRYGFDGCSSLSDISSLTSFVQRNKKHHCHLSFNGCSKLTDFSCVADLFYDDMLGLPESVTSVIDAKGLKTLEGHSELRKNLSKLTIQNGSELKDIAALGNLEGLYSLSLRGCKVIEHVDELKNLKKLVDLKLGGCWALKDIKGLKSLKELRSLSLRYCGNIKTLTPIKGAKKMRHLDIAGLSKLKNLNALKDMKDLQKLFIFKCTLLKDVDAILDKENLGLGQEDAYQKDSSPIEECTSLAFNSVLSATSLPPFDFRLVKFYPPNHKGRFIKNLTIDYRFKGLKSLEGIDEFISLESLELAPDPEHFDDIDYSCLSGLRALRHLSYLRIPETHDFSFFRGLPNLERLDLGGCALSKNDCSNIASLKKLKWLTLGHNYATPAIDNLDLLSSLPELERLDLDPNLTVKCETIPATIDFLLPIAGLSRLKHLNVYVPAWTSWSKKTFETLGEVKVFQNRLTAIHALNSGELIKGSEDVLELDLSYADSIESLESIEQFANLNRLSLANSYNLKDIKALKGLSKLEHLNLENCIAISREDITALSNYCSATDIVLPPEWIICEQCGGTSFSGRYGCYYADIEWVTAHENETITTDASPLQDRIKSAYRSLKGKLNDLDFYDVIDKYSSALEDRCLSYDVNAIVRCNVCGDNGKEIKLPEEYFKGFKDIRELPSSASKPWWDQVDLAGFQIDDPADIDEGLACPKCNEGVVQLSAQAVYVQYDAGKASGSIGFTEAREFEGPKQKDIWNNRLEFESSNSNSTDMQVYPAKYGFRVTIGCSTDSCWRSGLLSNVIQSENEIKARMKGEE